MNGSLNKQNTVASNNNASLGNSNTTSNNVIKK